MIHYQITIIYLQSITIIHHFNYRRPLSPHPHHLKPQVPVHMIYSDLLHRIYADAPILLIFIL
jgi:hypothetical protein